MLIAVCLMSTCALKLSRCLLGLHGPRGLKVGRLLYQCHSLMSVAYRSSFLRLNICVSQLFYVVPN
jgi:hypothetical protein